LHLLTRVFDRLGSLAYKLVVDASLAAANLLAATAIAGVALFVIMHMTGLTAAHQ